MAADNILTWDRVVMVVALVAGLEIDIANLLISVIHQRDFKTSTTYPCAYIIFQLCRDDRVPLWYYDVLCSTIVVCLQASSGMRPMWRHLEEGLELN